MGKEKIFSNFLIAVIDLICVFVFLFSPQFSNEYVSLKDNGILFSVYDLIKKGTDCQALILSIAVAGVLLGLFSALMFVFRKRIAGTVLFCGLTSCEAALQFLIILNSLHLKNGNGIFVSFHVVPSLLIIFFATILPLIQDADCKG